MRDVAFYLGHHNTGDGTSLTVDTAAQRLSQPLGTSGNHSPISRVAVSGPSLA